MRKIFACLAFLLCYSLSNAQDFSNKGKDFWVSYSGHIDGTTTTMGIYITSDVAATGTVQVGTTAVPFSVAANTVTRIFLGTGASASASNSFVYLSQMDGIKVGAAIHVTANKPVAVYAHIINAARSGATLVLPVNVWGKEYVAPSYRNTGSSASYGEINIMAADTNTVVEITPAVASRNGVRPAGVPFVITLANPGDVYQLQFATNADISGTKIKSIASGVSGCKPIGVFSATTWSAFDCNNASGGDNLYQQLFPLSAWGKNFLTAPFKNRNYDIVRVFVSDPTTVVNKTEGGITAALGGLVNNSYYEYKTGQPTKLQADKPISVVQYITSQSCYTNTIFGDPEMVVLSPVEQTINNITVFSAHQNVVPTGESNVTQCFLNIIIPTSAAASFRINNLPPTAAFVPIPNSTFSYLQENVTSITLINPVQTLKADSSFSAIAYGYGSVESYGYNAGTNVKDLYQHIIIRNEHATVDFPVTCVNAPFNLAITLPYLAQSLHWDFHGAFTNITNNAPVPDSSYIIDNKMVYVYRLPTPYIVNTPGTFHITVTAINPTSDGCSGSNQIDYDVEVLEKPKAKFYFLHSGCLSDTVQFRDTTDGIGRPVNRWRWQFGDGNIDSTHQHPRHLYGTSGTFNVNLRAITDVGCIADTTIPITITAAPVARFGNSSLLCPGTPVVFTDSSTVASGSIVRWYWNYGNGQRDTLSVSTPRTIIYDTAGTYTVTLQVEGAGGCKSLLFSKTIIINAAPVAGFATPIICMPSGIGQFTNNSTIANGTTAQMTYLWNFGDGNSSNLINPFHQYSGTGPFTITLTATSNFGCTDTAQRILNTVYPQPLALFTAPAEKCLGDSAAFNDQSTAPNSTVSKWFWSFGDGTTDTIPSPVHLYQTAGTYTVKLLVQSQTGCYSDTLSKQININALPIANFTIGAQTCLNQGITFTSTSTAGSGTLATWQWVFGDGRSLDTTAGNVIHAYDSIRTYNVSLTVINSKGCKSLAVVKPVSIAAQPVVNFGLPEVCLSDPFAEFTDSSTISDGTAAAFQYLWNFGDPGSPSNTSTLKNGRHTYTAANTYNVTLTVTSSRGCTATLTKPVTINGETPLADFIIQNTGNSCSADSIAIQNKSTVNFGSVTRVDIYWDYTNNPTVVFTDNTPSFNKVYKNIYNNGNASSKVYTIRLVAYSGGICVSSTQKNITVFTNPVASIGINMAQVCAGTALNFTDSSVNTGLNITGWNWNFGDGGTGSVKSLSHTYNTAGNFTIRLQNRTAEGCASPVDSLNVRIYPLPAVNAGPDVMVLEGGQVQIKASVSGSSAYVYKWTPATWLSDSSILQPVSVPQADIIYTLTVTGLGNCAVSDVVAVKILKGIVIPNAFSPNGDGVNDKWVIQYLESYPGSTVQVYDRYGRIVFNAPGGYTVAWDGRLNNAPLAIGTYYYIIDPKNGRKPITGSVTILR